MELRPFQAQALAKLQEEVHLVCLSPTGSGKSLIYERAAQMKGARTLLITPLIALARQQFQCLLRLGLKVRLGVGPKGQLPDASSEVWIVSPERIKMHSQKAFKNWTPNFLVVDECHCFWEWGEEFRPAFDEIPKLIHQLKIPKSLWLTATLPHHARIELIQRLPTNTIVQGRFSLPKKLHLQLKKAPWVERISLCRDWIKDRGPGVLFVQTRKMADRLGEYLRNACFSARSYHAGMSHEEKQIIENDLRSGKIQILVSTSAFGMGMDQKNLLWAVLWQSPPSLLSLAQSIGRVGRSNKMGNALIFWSDIDFQMVEWTLGASERKRKDLFETFQFFQRQECRRMSLERYFEKVPDKTVKCKACDYCDLLS